MPASTLFIIYMNFVVVVPVGFYRGESDGGKDILPLGNLYLLRQKLLVVSC